MYAIRCCLGTEICEKKRHAYWNPQLRVTPASCSISSLRATQRRLIACSAGRHTAGLLCRRPRKAAAAERRHARIPAGGAAGLQRCYCAVAASGAARLQQLRRASGRTAVEPTQVLLRAKNVGGHVRGVVLAQHRQRQR